MRRMLVVMCLAPVACGGSDGNVMSPDARPGVPDAAPPTAPSYIADVRVYGDEESAVVAEFRDSATILRVDDAPECVIHAEALVLANPRNSPAGRLVVGGSFIGAPGAPEGPIVPPVGNTFPINMYLYQGPTFTSGTDRTIEVSLLGALGFPSMPVQLLRTPGPERIQLTTPLLPRFPPQIIELPRGGPLELRWTPTTLRVDDVRIIVHLRLGPPDLPYDRKVSVHCSYPPTAGAATIPRSVFAEAATQIGREPRGASLDVLAGSMREFAIDGTTSYIVEAVSFETMSPTVRWAIVRFR